MRTGTLEPVSPSLAGVRRILNVPMIPSVTMLWAVCAIEPALRAVREHNPRAIFCSGPQFSGFVTGAIIPVDGGVTASTGQFLPPQLLSTQQTENS